MIAAKVIWTDNERYTGEANSRHALVMDTASEKTANTPMELVLIALCGCTASDVVGVLRKKREPFTHLEVRAEGERASGYPAVYTEIRLTNAAVVKCLAKLWKTPCASRKKSI